MGWSLCVLGGLFYSSLYSLLILSLKHYWGSRLSNADVYLIAEKCINSLQALMTTTIGLFIANSCQENIMSDTHWITNMYTWFGLPYFLYDTWAIYNTHFYLNEDKLTSVPSQRKLVHFIKHNIAMLIHHLLFTLFWFSFIPYFRNNKAEYFVGLFFACEAAVPFIAIRFILAQLKLKDSVTYNFISLLMIAMFVITRFAPFPFLYWKYGQYAGLNLPDIPFAIPLHCNVGCFLILLSQVYFFRLMVPGAARVFYKMFTKRKTKAH